jgi:hypothetical protein
MSQVASRLHLYGAGGPDPTPANAGNSTVEFTAGAGFRSCRVPAGAGTPWIGSPVGGIFNARSDAMVGHRLVIEARDDMQVGVEPALIVPAECVTVGSEPLL